MNKQEFIGKIKSANTIYLSLTPFIEKKLILDLVKQLDEPQKVTVPQFVADWIKTAKTVYSLSGGMTYGGPGVNKWLENENNQRTFVLAWFDGYEVEKEKRYLVKVKGFNDYGCYLNKGLLSKEYFCESKAEIGGCRTKHTRKQLEDAGFGWVFDCEGIEIEEVEE